MAPPAVAPLVSWYSRLVLTYVSGLVTAPYVALLVKPVLQGAVKTTIRVAWEVKRLAAEAAEECTDLATEAAADLAEVENITPPGAPESTTPALTAAPSSASKKR